MTEFFNVSQAMVPGQKIGGEAFKASMDANLEAAQTNSINQKTLEAKDAYDQILNRRAIIANNQGGGDQMPQVGDKVGPLVRDPVNGGWTDAPQQAPKQAPLAQAVLGTPAASQGPVGPSAMSQPQPTGEQPLGPSSLASIAMPQGQGQAKSPYNFPEVNPLGINRTAPQVAPAPQAAPMTSEQILAQGKGPLTPAAASANGLPPTGVAAYDTAQAQMPKDNPADLTGKGYGHPADTLLANSFNAGDTSAVLKGKMPAQIVTPFAKFDAQGAYDDLMASGDLDGAEHLRALVTKAGLDSEKIKIEQRQVENANLYGAASAIGMLPPAARDRQWKAWRDGEIAQGKDPDSIPQSYNPSYVGQLAKQSLSVSDQLEQDHKTITEQTHAMNAETARIKAEKEKEAEYTEVKQADGVWMVNKHNPADKYRMGALPPSAGTNISFNPLTPEAQKAGVGATKLEDIKDPTTRNAIQGVGSGQLPLSTFPVKLTRGQSGLDQQSAAGIIRGIYPGWDERLSAQAKKTIVDFAADGTSGKALISLSGIAEHAGQLQEAGRALKSGDTPALNAIANRWGLATGKDPVTTYNTIATFLGDETEKFLSGGSPTIEGRKGWASLLSADASDNQRNGALNAIKHGVAGKLVGYDTAYKNATSNNGANPELGKSVSDTGLLSDAGKELVRSYNKPKEGPLVPGQSTKIIYDAKGQPHTAKLSADGKRWEL
jgi:hypothetical protein